MDDRILALCELSGDLLFHRIPREKLGYYVDGSLAAGRKAAELFRGQSIRDLYSRFHIEIQEKGSGKQGYGVILRGQAVMAEEGCSVEIYRDSIEQLAAHSAWCGTSLTGEQALDVHLAHEFFHIWEYREHRSIAEELDAVERFSFLGLRPRGHITRCCEIAAHAFARELLGLPALPNLYDYLYLIGTGKLSQEAFDAMIDEKAEQLKI